MSEPPQLKNATSVTLEELAQADYAVEQALKFFNYAPLVNRLRSAEPFRLELNVAADIISGKARGQNSPKHYALGNFI